MKLTAENDLNDAVFSDVEPSALAGVGGRSAEIAHNSQRRDLVGDIGVQTEVMLHSTSEVSVTENVYNGLQQISASGSCSISEFSWPLADGYSASECSAVSGKSLPQHKLTEARAISECSTSLNYGNEVPVFTSQSLSPGSDNHEPQCTP